jgi:DNA-binding LacI/PurR family transcriptional regulator
MVTQEQIARKLGISRQLVTFALAGYPQVSDASRKRILDAARRMGYRPNPFARALKRARTGILALWIPDQISTYYTHVARELNRHAKQGRQELVVSEVTLAEAEQVWPHVPVDGIFAVDAPEPVLAHLATASARRVPVVSMGAHCCHKTDTVQVDMLAGAMEAMEHLIGAGYRRIAHATFVTEDRPGANRRAGYLKAMQQAGLQPEFVHYPVSDQQRPVTRRLIQEYIQAHGRPEALFCHSDDVALGMYRGLCDLGLRVPHDVALVGCDGIQDTEYLECPLSTIVQPVTEMCAAAWKFLLARLEKPRGPLQRLTLSPKLAIRVSSIRVPGLV